MTLPMTVEELTEDWVIGALAQRNPGVAPQAVEIDHVIWGTATKALLTVTYADGAGDDGPPQRLCVKGALDDKMRQYDSGGACLLEAAFYKEIADGLAPPMAHCWYAEYSAEQRQGIIILDDLSAAGAGFGQPTEPWPVDRVAAALELLAQWHGATWGMDAARYPWMSVGSSSVRIVTDVILGEEHWNAHFSAPYAPALPESLRDRTRILDALKAMWREDDTKPLALSHYDPHLGNTFIEADGAPGFLDWQGVCVAPYIDDITYFMGGALTIEDRRGSERELLASYLRALHAAGGPELQLDRDGVWTEYRRHHLHGFLWAVTPPVMQSPENVAAMTARYVAALEDHDSLSV